METLGREKITPSGSWSPPVGPNLATPTRLLRLLHSFQKLSPARQHAAIISASFWARAEAKAKPFIPLALRWKPMNSGIPQLRKNCTQLSLKARSPGRPPWDQGLFRDTGDPAAEPA